MAPTQTQVTSVSETLPIANPDTWKLMQRCEQPSLGYHYLAPVEVSKCHIIMRECCTRAAVASAWVGGNHIWALIAANNRVWTSEKRLREWHVFMMSIHRSWHCASACQRNPLCGMCNWLMGPRNPGWQGKVIGWYNFESSRNWLTSEVQPRATGL